MEYRKRRVEIKLTQSEYDACVACAEDLEEKLSVVIRLAMKEYIKRAHARKSEQEK